MCRNTELLEFPLFRRMSAMLDLPPYWKFRHVGFRHIAFGHHLCFDHNLEFTSTLTHS